MNIQEYIKEDGSSPFQVWFDTLDATAAAKVVVAKSRLAQGNTSNIKWFSGIGEYKIDWGPGYRIYLVRDGNELIILYMGGTKKDQQSDIANAIALHQEYQQRKRKDQQEKATAEFNQDKAQTRQKQHGKRKKR
jgi:putative addiction module killer protein